MKQVIIALYPRILATSVALSMDVLEGVSQAVSAQKRGRQQINFRFAAKSIEEIAAVGGWGIRPEMTLEAIDYCDMLLLPALWRNPLPVLRQQQAWLPLLRRLHRQGTIICSAGTASCFMAEAGLLDGKAATTHWNYFDAFMARYPEVNLKRRHLITQADNLYCAGSVNSIADLMLHIAEEWFGQRIARTVENQFSPEIRRPFRAHAFQSSEDASHHDELVLDAQQWLQDNLHCSISIAELAAAVDCPASTLSRRFKLATGKSPLAYLQARRITSARELLRMANLSVGEVAWQVGFQDVSYFTSLFRREVGITPARYRNSVRGKLFSNRIGKTAP
ncbi:MAG: helix-turn-helix domain-containing protein [Halieaceae bacterium]|nr:helix-turn-helix domain-containing protein [Halieaceae bacterium]